MKLNKALNMTKWRLSTRLITLFVLLGLTPFLIIGGYSYWISSDALHHNTEERLLTVREDKKAELKDYSSLIRHQLITFAEDRMVINAMQEFSEGFARVEDELAAQYDANTAEYEELLKKRYVHQQKNTHGVSENAIDSWWPTSKTARILQHHYISGNPYEIGDKRKLDFAQDGSSYSKTHRKFHPIFRDYMERFEYYDIFLVEPGSGNVVYSIDKEIDFATNLLNGPYQNTSFARVFKRAVESNTKDSIHFDDIQLYSPSYNTSASFASAPIFDDNRLIGVLVFQVPAEKIDQIMTGDKSWPGEGKTGESFLIGTDYLFRSNSRPMIEDMTQFIKNMKAAGIPDEQIEEARGHNSLVSHVEFKREYIQDALEQNSGFTEGTNYLGQKVILAYTSAEFLGTTWALVSTISHDEAFSALKELKNAVMLLGGVIALIVIALGGWFARSISMPLSQTIAILSTSSTEIATTIAEQEQVAKQQASSINQTNTTMGELAVSSRQTAEQAQTAAHSTETVLALTQEGTRKVNDMLQAMATLKDKVETIARQILHLSEQTSQIGGITSLVTDFANETKMMAMNAAVEAVRAGEHGKGFSVLSVEIRKLADESKRSADRINALVEDVQKATNATVMATDEGTKTVETGIRLAEETATTFDSVTSSISEVTNSTQQISLNVRQQAEAINQGLDAMKILAVAARESAAGLSQTKTGIQSLEGVSRQLRSLI